VVDGQSGRSLSNALKEDKGGSCHTCCTQLGPPAPSPCCDCGRMWRRLRSERCTQLVLFDVNWPRPHTEPLYYSHSPESMSLLIVPHFPISLSTTPSALTLAAARPGRASWQGTSGSLHRPAPTRGMMDAPKKKNFSRRELPAFSVYSGPPADNKRTNSLPTLSSRLACSGAPAEIVVGLPKHTLP
jgi:hypothetical protein